MNKRPIVMLEFNELCPDLMSQFIEEGHLPNFKKLRDESASFISEAPERAPMLDPWIQWINVHTGVPYAQHGVEHLGESDKCTYPAVWDLISDHGGRAWICGSMNVHCTSQIKGFLLPDPWSPEAMTRPAEFQTYNRFVRKQVQEHSNASAKFAKSDYLKFGKFMLKHGLSLHTIKAAISQLLGERKQGKRWRRAFILDLLQYDVFAHIYEQQKPDFSTFFLNSTAHMQHCYWRNFQPELFKIKPTEKEQQEYSSAILDGYTHMDALIGRIRALVGADATIFFATALSQQPFLKFEDAGGKHIYRPKDLPAFTRWAGIENLKQCNPVMAEQFWLEFETPEDAESAAIVLRGLTINGEPAFKVEPERAAVFTGFNIRRKIGPDEVLESAANGAKIRFYDLLYAIEGIKSGMHHPDGLLWIFDPSIPKGSNPRVPTESITPTILELLSIPVPAHMQSPSVLHHQAIPAMEPELLPAD